MSNLQKLLEATNGAIISLARGALIFSDFGVDAAAMAASKDAVKSLVDHVAAYAAKNAAWAFTAAAALEAAGVDANNPGRVAVKEILISAAKYSAWASRQ